MRSPTALVLSAAGLLSACALLTNLDDLGSADAAFDANRDQAAGDANVDAGLPQNPCLSPHSLCCDFDDGGLDACWGTFVATAGQVDLSDAKSVSPPMSMHVRLDNSGVNYAVARLPGGNASAVCTFDVYFQSVTVAGTYLSRIDTQGPSPAVVMVIGPGDAGPNSVSAALGSNATDAGFGYSGGDIQLPARSWLRLALAFDIPSSGGGVGTLSGVGFDAGQLTLATTVQSTTYFTFGSGLASFPSGFTNEVYLDNVACDTK